MVSQLLSRLSKEEANLNRLHWSIVAALAVFCQCGCQWMLKGEKIDSSGKLTPPAQYAPNERSSSKPLPLHRSDSPVAPQPAAVQHKTAPKPMVPIPSADGPLLLPPTTLHFVLSPDAVFALR